MEKSLLNKWLDKLQQESWQLELLISGFAIFGLFSLRDFIHGEMELFYANVNTEFTFQLTYTVLVVVLLVTHIYIINLLIHIMIRGLWIGAIGLRYVSGDIDYDKLKYNNRFIKYYKRTVGSFDDYIIKLEKLSSIIFSFTFLLFFVFLSFFLFFFATVFFSYVFEKMGVDSSSVFIKIFKIVWMFLFGLVAFDFITLGLLRKIKQRHFSKFYLILYRFVGVITLSFFWRALLLNFLDQKFTKRLLIAIVPYILVVVILLPNSSIDQYEFFPQIFSSSLNGQFSFSQKSVNAHSFNAKFYDSMRKGSNSDFKLIQDISLPSYKVKGNLFEVFVKFTGYNDTYLEFRDSSLVKNAEVGYHNTVFGRNDFFELSEDEKEKNTQEFLDQLGTTNKKKIKAIKDSLSVEYQSRSEKLFSDNLLKIKDYIKDGVIFFIDDEMIPDSLFSIDFYVHPNAGEKGMLSFFPIDLSLGRHSFSYYKKYLNPKTLEIDTMKMSIPFIYEGK